jgi:hypothetical protein
MIHVQQGGSGVPPQERERLAQLIRAHIARGNKPEYERVQELSASLDEMASHYEPSGHEMTEQEISELARDLCGRRNLIEEWSLVRTDEHDGAL